MKNKNINIVRAISNPKRLEVAFLLNESKELKVGEIEKIVGLSQSALSQHLAVMRKAGVVKIRREAQTIFYSLDNDIVTKILGILK